MAYIVTANTADFEKGMIATRQELRASKKLMEESVPAIEKYEKALANVDSMLAKGLIDKKTHTETIGRLKTEYGQMGTSAALLATGSEKFGQAIKGYATAAVGVFSVSKGIGMIKEQFGNIDATVKDAEKLGIAIDDLMRLRGVADMAGDATAESVDKAIAKLNMNLKDLREGADSAVAMFEQIGLTAKDLEGLDLGDAFLKVSDGIAMIEGADKQLAVTQEILGKGAGDLANMLKMGSDEIERMGKGIPAVNALDAEKIAKAKDAMESVERSMDSIAQILAVTMAPAIEKFATAVRFLMGDESALGIPEQVGLRKFATAQNMIGSEKIQSNIAMFKSNTSLAGQFDKFMNAASGINPEFNISKLRSSSPEADRIIKIFETGKFGAINNMTKQQSEAQEKLFDQLLNEVIKMREATDNGANVAAERLGNQTADIATNFGNDRLRRLVDAATAINPNLLIPTGLANRDTLAGLNQSPEMGGVLPATAATGGNAAAAQGAAAATPGQSQYEQEVKQIFQNMSTDLMRLRQAQEQANENRQSEGAKIE